MAGSDDNSNDRTIVRKVKRPSGSRLPQPGGREIVDADEPTTPPNEPIRTIVRGGSSRRTHEPGSVVDEEARGTQRRVGTKGSKRRDTHGERAGSEYFNYLLDEAASLIALGGYLRSADRPRDLDQLRTEIVDAVLHYRRSVEGKYSDSTVRHASFALCAFLDDCVLCTFWGKDSAWANQSVLAEVHRTAHRQKLIEQIREHMVSPPDPHLLGMYHTILSLGFGGVEGDPQAVEILKNDVYRSLTRHIEQPTQSLVDESLVKASTVRPIARRLPAWTILAAAGVVLALMFVGFRFLLGPSIRDFEDKVENLGDGQTRLTVQDFFPDVEAPVQVTVNLHVLLQTMIDQGLVSLYDAQPGTTILLRSDEMFASGSANLKPGINPVLVQLSEALNATSGILRVEGHTDNVPYRGGLTTNEVLSDERAEQVALALAKSLHDSSRLRVRGLADRAPLECNNSSEARARNRRVEILLEDVETTGIPPLPRPNCGDGAD
jgi:type VI secretion system protein ImpK